MASTEGSFRALRLISGGVGVTFVILLLSKGVLFGVTKGGAGSALRAPGNNKIYFEIFFKLRLRMQTANFDWP